MKIFDCFLFFGEVEALGIRFHELRDVVDYHVIVEGTMTFSGQPRDVAFDASDPRWASFLNKVIHVVVDDTPEEAGDWGREHFQRNAILRGLDLFQSDRSGPVCEAQDLVLICDADEIPSADAVRRVASNLVRGVASFELTFYYYHLNQLVCQPHSGDAIARFEPISWWLARAARRADVRWPQEVRDLALHECAYVASHAGWHFSYLGGVQRIQTKIGAFSHQELNQPQYTDATNIADAIESGRDLFGRDSLYHIRTVPIDDSFPRFVVENQESFRTLMKAIDNSEVDVLLEEAGRAMEQMVGGQMITRIIEATYGSGENWVDVTAQLQDRVRNGHLSLTVSNTLFGDPCPNRRKTLRFTYELADDSRQYQHEVAEHQRVSLGILATYPASLNSPDPTDPLSSPETERQLLEPIDQFPTCAHFYLDLVKTCLTRFAFERDQGGYDAAAYIEGRDWSANAETMIGLRRLDNIENCLVDVLRRGVPGDFVDAGVWRGGSAIFMRAVLKAFAVSTRTVWAADSFADQLQPNTQRFMADAEDRDHGLSTPVVSLDEVKANFARYNLLDEQVRLLVGQFHDTLPTAPIDQVSILRLDDVSYESTMVVLGALYDRLSSGGCVIVDDYGAVPGCRQATDDFRADHGINDPIQRVDWSGVYWRKSE